MLAPAIKLGGSLLGKGISFTKTGIKESSGILKKAILKRTKIKREQIARSKVLDKRRLDRQRKEEKESLLEAVPKSRTGIAGPIVDKAQNFLQSILEFFGILLVGWLANNLPTIITMVKNLIKRIQTLVSSLTGFVTNLTKWIGGLGNVIGARIKNIATLDFNDSSGRVKKAMKELDNSFKAMQNDIDKGFRSLTTPLGEGEGEEMAAPFGTDYAGTSEAVQDPNVRAFLDVLALPESGGRYNVSVGGKLFSDMSKHPEMYNPELDSDAAGRYQFISTTYKPIARRLGLTDFSAKSQDLAAVQYLKDLGVLDEIQSGDPRKIQSAVDRLKKSTWTGLQKYSPGQAVKYFQQRRTGYEAGSISPSTTVRAPGGPVQQTYGTSETGAGFNPSGARDQKGRPVVLSQSAASAFAAMMRDSRGVVKGSDVASSQRSPAKNERVGGATGSLHLSGLALDIHGASNKWIRKNGAKYGWYANDYSGTHGGHFEFRGGGARNMQIAETARTVPNLEQQRQRQQIIIIDDEQPSQNAPAILSGGEEMIIMVGESLNRFMKKKLLHELSYT